MGNINGSYGLTSQNEYTQRIYRTPLIIGKRQILQLSSGQAANGIEYIAVMSEEIHERRGESELDKEKRRE